MPSSFPSNPTINQTTIQNGRTYQWSGYSWDFVANIAQHSSSHSVSGTDPLNISISQINDLGVGISGILPVKNIVAGTGISITSASGVFVIDSTTSGVTTDQIHPFLLGGM